MTRVVGQDLEIDEDAVHEFFVSRSRRARSAHPLTAVLYQDQEPELAEQRDRYERMRALPLLDLQKTSRVLDLGCGIGRWAPDIAERADTYCGVDFSDELLDVARSRASLPGVRFEHLPMQDADPVLLGEPQGFDRVLMAGVLIYVNDPVALQTLRAVARCAADRCRIYLREPTAVEVRLTLSGHWSQDLSCEYSAVYRTHDELVDLLDQTVLSEGFTLLTAEDLYPDDLNNRRETRQRVYLLERA